MRSSYLRDSTSFVRSRWEVHCGLVMSSETGEPRQRLKSHKSTEEFAVVVVCVKSVFVVRSIQRIKYYLRFATFNSPDSICSRSIDSNRA